MRVIVAIILLVAALIAVAASMGMNWSFWTAQGVDERTSRVLGAVSVMVDIFKATLPIVIAWAWAERMRLGATIATVLFCGCLTFSFITAIGFASWLRGAATGNREAVTLRYNAANGELGEVAGRLLTLKSMRPRAVIEEAIERSKQDRRWASSGECKEATVEASRTFCVGLGDLRVELASSIERDKLQRRNSDLAKEIDQLVKSGARLDNDLQPAILARLSGVRLTRVQHMLVLLVAVVVELSAGFGLFLALLPLRTNPARIGVMQSRPRMKANLARRLGAAKAPSKPTRLVRNPDGQLMIE